MESFVDIRLIRELVTAPAARELNADLWERARFAQNWLRTNPTQLESYEGPLFELAATPGQWGAFCSLESYLVGLLLEDLDIDSTTQRRWITKTLDVLLSVREPLVRHSLMDGINWFGMALRNRSPRNRLTIGLLLIESDRRYGPLAQTMLDQSGTLGDVATALAAADIERLSIALGIWIGGGGRPL